MLEFQSTSSSLETEGRAALSKLRHCLSACCNQSGRLLGTSGMRLLDMADTICIALRPSYGRWPVARCNMLVPNPQTSVWLPLRPNSLSTCSGALCAQKQHFNIHSKHHTIALLYPFKTDLRQAKTLHLRVCQMTVHNHMHAWRLSRHTSGSYHINHLQPFQCQSCSTYM